MTVTKNDTVTFKKDSPDDCKLILKQVYQSLVEKGYDPVQQLVGYLATEEPTYITNSNGARSLITKVSRYALLQELIETYMTHTEN